MTSVADELSASESGERAEPSASGSRPVTKGDERRRDEEAERRERATQSFWAVAVGVPAVVSVMRLVVEAGGELQTTLLLVANVNPVNLVAAFIITSTQMVSALLILLFALSAVLTVSVQGWDGERGVQARRSLIVRWKTAAPTWFVGVVIVVAIFTWEILYLPFLVPAVMAMFQLSPVRIHPNPIVAYGSVGLLLVAYGVFLIGPTLLDAARQGEPLVIALLVVPPLLGVAITGTIHPASVRLLMIVGPLIMWIAVGWTAYSVLTTPVLPLTVTTVEVTDGPVGNSDGTTPTEEIRGHVITVNDIHTVILEEEGVRYVRVEDVESQVLCPSEEELARYRLWVHGVHIENSILEAIGRRERPLAPVGAACRVVDDRNAPG